MYRDAAPRLQRLLASYLEGGHSVLEFQQEFIELYVRLPGGTLKDDDAAFWHEVFGLVTRTAPEPADGALDDLELKTRLGELWRKRLERGVGSLRG
jgi:hypothetical protein